MIGNFSHALYEVIKYFVSVYADFEVLKGDRAKVEITQCADNYYGKEDTELLIKIITKRLYNHGYLARDIKYNYDFPTNEFNMMVAAKITFIIDL